MAPALTWFVFLSVGGARAQEIGPGEVAPTAPIETLKAITVHRANNDEQGITPPSVQLDGMRLQMQQEASLGNTLDGLAGVHADTFGGGASRPVIRGQTAPRVQIMLNGSATLDASDISPDHTVTVEPLLAQRIELFRGPSALRYGNAAATGVVNVVDSKIPEEIPQEGYGGEVALRGGTGTVERVAAAGVTAGVGRMAIRLEALRRKSDDYRVPHWSEDHLDNSWAQSSSGSAGVSWIGEQGYLGAAYTQTESRYGLPGHSHAYHGCHPHGSHLHCETEDHADEDHALHSDHVHVSPDGSPWVKLRSQRVDLRGEWRNPFTGISAIRLVGGLTDYRHHEIDAGVVATTFRNRGYDGRVELEHEPVAGWQGVVGLNMANSRFSASGQESFLPATTTHGTSIFAIEKYEAGSWVFEVGARYGQQTIRAQDARPEVSHGTTSFSGAARWAFLPSYTLGLTASRTQRAPNSQELFADGVHLATNTFELGNPNLTSETAQQLELGLYKTEGATQFKLAAYLNRVRNYIYADTLDRHESFRLIRYAQADATFHGMEASLDQRVGRHFTVGVFGDLVRGRLEDEGGNLPRIPPARAGVKLGVLWQDWSGEMTLSRAFAQTRVAGYEDSTAGFTMVNASLAYEGTLSGQEYTVYLRGTNLLDRRAINHASFLGPAAPLPGRQVMLGVRLALN